MSSPPRCQVLRWSAALIPVAFAGCIDRNEPARDTRVDQLQVVNYEDNSYTLRMEITENDKTVYESSVEIPPAADASSELGDDRWSGASFEDYPTKAGSYTIRAWRSDQPQEEGLTLDLTGYDYECARIRVHIGEAREDSGPGLSFWRTFDCSKSN